MCTSQLVVVSEHRKRVFRKMPGQFQSGWTLAFMKIILMVFDFALWVKYLKTLLTYSLKNKTGDLQ